jgi:hypothetical protein
MRTFDRKVFATLAALLLCGLASESAWAVSYDDARVTNISVIAQNPADQQGPMSFYEKGKLKVVCQYGYVQTGSGAAIPWVNVRLYVLSNQGVPLVFRTTKGCLSQTCTADGDVPTNIGTGAVGVGCMVTRLDGPDLKDANPANNKKETFIVIKPRPVKLGSAQSSPVVGKPGMGVVPGLSGHVKQCPTSLSATVKVDAHQFAGPLNSPADMAETKVTLYFKNSQTAGNNVVCRYATHNKDVPDLVVTIKCPNASAQSGKPGAFNCTD